MIICFLTQYFKMPVKSTLIEKHRYCVLLKPQESEAEAQDTKIKISAIYTFVSIHKHAL